LTTYSTFLTRGEQTTEEKSKEEKETIGPLWKATYKHSVPGGGQEVRYEEGNDLAKAIELKNDGFRVFFLESSRLSKIEHPYFLVIDIISQDLVYSCKSREEAVQFSKQFRRKDPEQANRFMLIYYRPTVQNFFGEFRGSS
jgi:hypothetical protein